MDGAAELYDALTNTEERNGAPMPLYMRLGLVKTLNPLTIEVAGTTQEAERFYASARLLGGYEETVNISGKNFQLKNASIKLALGGLKQGDEVLLLTEDDQTFYVIDKVVKL